jgi:uncharacterized protein (TIGR03437 family)
MYRPGTLRKTPLTYVNLMLLVAAGAAVPAASGLTPSGTLAPATGSPFAVDAGPQAVAVGDSTGSGNLDIVTANSAGNNVTVLWGNGLGGFAANPLGPFTVGNGPRAVAVVDVNGDGLPDIVTANSADNTVTVLLNNGSGGFAAAAGSPFAVGTQPESLVVSDFNGDGYPDIVTANLNDSNVTLLLGNGAGGFTAAQGSPFAVGAGPHSVATGDFNGDGKPDLVTANSGSNTVTIILGNGTGGFTGPRTFAAPSSPQSIAVGDFNMDGKLDVVTADSGGTTVTVLLGDGSGGFGAGTQFTVGSNPDSVAVGDFNGDGKPDIVAANSGGNTLILLLGNGAGGFTAAGGSPFAVGSFPSSIAVGDFNGDGRADIAIANAGGNSAAVLLGALAATDATLSTTLSTTATGTVAYGASVALKLTVTQPSGGFTTPTGSATLLDGTATIATATQTGSPYTFTAASLAPGIHALTATYGGDTSNASSASNTVSLTVATEPQTITFAALSSQALGSAPFTVTATVSSGLAVSFTSTTAQVCSVAGATVTLVAGGTCTIQAAQAGNTQYSAATVVSRSFTVTPASQTITFGSLASLPLGTAPFTPTATASSGLTVSFTSTTISVCKMTGTTVTLVSVGTCTIQAAQSGNTSYAAAASVTQSFTVTQGSQTITFAAPANQVLGGAPFKITATASSGLAVVFSSATQGICTVAASTVTLVSAGQCSIQASQIGSSSYVPAAPVTQSFTVAQATQTITFGALTSKVMGTAPFTITATASSSLAVVFYSETQGTCSVSSGTVTLLGTGTCTLQATQPGNTSYAAAAPVTQSFTVTGTTQTITFAPLTSVALGETPLAITATASSGLTVYFSSETTATCTVSGSAVTTVATGACTIQASQPGNSTWSAAPPVTQSFTITPGPPAIASVLNAASYGAAPLAAQGFATIFGTNLSKAPAQATTTALPITLGGMSVTITDSSGTNQPAQLDYVSPTQMNVLMPKNLAIGSATLTVSSASGTTTYPATVAAISPSLFTADSSGSGAPAAFALSFAAGSSTPQVLPVASCIGTPAVCAASPINLSAASTKVYLELFGTGIRGRSSLAGVSVSLGGVLLDVTYAGPQSTFAGLDQVNVLLDRSLIGQGQLPLQMVVDGVAANPVVVDIE